MGSEYERLLPDKPDGINKISSNDAKDTTRLNGLLVGSWEPGKESVRSDSVREIHISNLRPSIRDFSATFDVDGSRNLLRRWKSRVTMINLCWANFAAWTCYALLAPFFPQEARLKDVPEFLVGFIFGVYELVVFLTAPIFGLVVHRIGHKFLFVSGVFVCGSCSVLFGLLVYCPPGGVYIGMCFITRIIQALGASAFLTACYTLAAKEFPEKVSFIVGILETCSGVGLMVGPLIGGAFYDLGGFGLPFYTMGGVLVLTAPLSYAMLTEQKLSRDATEDAIPMRKLLCNVNILIVTLTTVTSAFAWSFLDPTLSDRLTPFGLSTVLVGLVFFLCPAVYAFASPLWGWLADKYKHVYIYLVLGNLACSVCFLLLGPAPFLGLPYALWLNIISLCLLGFCVGCTMIMAYRGFIDISLKLGFEQNLATFGCISGIFNSAMSLGAFLGPTVGGMLDNQLGFDWACAVCAILFLPVSLLSLIYFFILPKFCGFNPIKQDSHPSETIQEHKTLLSSSERNGYVTHLHYSDSAI